MASVRARCNVPQLLDLEHVRGLSRRKNNCFPYVKSKTIRDRFMHESRGANGVKTSKKSYYLIIRIRLKIEND